MWVNVGVVLFVLNIECTFQYQVPQPEITVHKPRGFSVSIPHESGIQLFAFHGNVNHKLVDLGAGEFSVDIRKHENGKWTFHNLSRKLKAGDVIYYWLFVIREGLGYRLDDGRFVVEESHNSHSSSDEHDTPLDTPLPPRQENPTCLEGILNVTRTLLEQQAQINVLELANQQMKTYIELQKDAKKITIRGRLPPDDDASSMASFILKEKLDLNPVIISAERNNDGSITFEVPSIEDKIEILQAARKKLATSTISIK